MVTKHIKGKYNWLKHFDFMVLDILALMISFILAYLLKFRDFSFALSASWKMIFVICFLLDLVIIFFTTPFSGIFRRSGTEELIKAALQAIYNFVLCCIVLYVLGIGILYSRTVIIATYILYFLFSVLLRNVWKLILKSGKATAIGNTRKTIFVVGNREEMPQLLRSINAGFFKEYEVKGICIANGEIGEKVTERINFIDNRGRVKEVYMNLENEVSVDGIAEYVLKNNIEEVFIGMNPSEVATKTYETLVANGKGIHIHIQPIIGFKTDDQFITTVGTYKTLSVGVYSFTGKQMVYLAIKRVIDILFGFVGLIAMLPLMVIIKIAYLASGDKKSIFYSQLRVGVNGQPFKMYKFRSMAYNADEILRELLKDEKYRKEWEENQKFEDDPRITGIGRFLRKTSLDEIPQFINVLKGDMSLIGPRPLIRGELEMHNGLQLYHLVKPGVTGWWGCNGRSNTTYDERLELEYFYIKNCSLYLDVLCIVKTIAVVLKRDGAK